MVTEVDVGRILKDTSLKPELKVLVAAAVARTTHVPESENTNAPVELLTEQEVDPALCTL
jgi:hypothetical protein